ARATRPAHPTPSSPCHTPRNPTTKTAAGTYKAPPKGIPYNARHSDRSPHLALGILDRLGNGFVRIVDVGLIKQAYLFVESLEPRFDNLVDHIRGLPLGSVLVGKYFLLAPDQVRVEAGRLDRLRIGGCPVHRKHAAEALEPLALASRLQRHENPDLSEAWLDGIVHVAANDAICDGQRGCSSQRHVLADLGNRVGNPLCQRD